MLRVVEQQQPQVALNLGSLQGRVGVAGVRDDHAAGPHVGPQLAQPRQDLLMDAVARQARVAREEPHLVHDGRLARPLQRRVLPH